MGEVTALTKKVQREKILLNVLPELSLQIMEHAKEHGRVTIGEMIIITNISRNTLKEHFRLLVKRGMLVMQGKGRGSWYRLP